MGNGIHNESLGAILITKIEYMGQTDKNNIGTKVRILLCVV